MPPNARQKLREALRWITQRSSEDFIIEIAQEALEAPDEDATSPSVKQRLLEFLKALEAKIPPPANCHHSITYNQYGSYTEGWQDRLSLNIMLPDGKFASGIGCHVFLWDGDLEKPIPDLVEEIFRKL